MSHGIHVQKVVHLSEQYIRGLIVRDIEHLTDRIDGILVGIDRYPHISFMLSPVHVSVYGKDHVAVVGKAEDPYIMPVIDIPYIECSEIIEAVDAGKF